MNQLDEQSHPIVKPINELLQKEVNRNEFLTIVGFGVLSLFGMGSIIHFFTGKNSKTIIRQMSDYTNHGYGGSRYGV